MPIEARINVKLVSEVGVGPLQPVLQKRCDFDFRF
jgi:hypothetical protein